MSVIHVQIEDCRTRYNGDADHHQRRKKFSFPARLICGDCYEVIAIIVASLSKFILSLASSHGLCTTKLKKYYASECRHGKYRAMLYLIDIEQ